MNLFIKCKKVWRDLQKSERWYLIACIVYVAGLFAWAIAVNDPMPETPSKPPGNFAIFKSAVEITIGTSSQINSACVLILTILAIFIGYMLTAKKPPEGFRACSVIAGLAAVTSMWSSGIAITKARNALWSGDFGLEAANVYFDVQVVLALVSILFFSIVLIVYGGRSRYWEDKASQATANEQESSDGVTVVHLGVRSSGAGGFWLTDAQGRRVIHLNQTAEGAGRVVVSTADGSETEVLAADANGRPPGG